MAKNRRPEPKAPDWRPEKTLQVLRQQIVELQKLKGRNYQEARNEEDAWQQFTLNVMIHGFGEDSQNVRHFHSAKCAGRHQLGGMPEQQLQENFRLRLEKFEVTLNSSVKELELMLQELESKAVYEASTRLAQAAEALNPAREKNQWDFFISHASEDKEAIATPLAEALKAKRKGVWYDDFSLKVGDSLRESIDHGLSRSSFGIVILSPRFFEKHWPKKELDGLAAREVNQTKVILPVWHGVGFDEVREYSPTLADRIAVSTEKGLEYVVEKILDATTGPSASAFVPEPAEQREQMVFEESVYWKVRHGQKEGPYCPNCYDDKRKEIHLNRGATKGTYACGICGNDFRTGEYDPRPARRRPFSSR